MVSSVNATGNLYKDSASICVERALNTPATPNQILWEHTAGRAYESVLPNAKQVATNAAEKGGFIAGLKGFWNFLMGEWGHPLGKMYREAKKANPEKVGITSFSWTEGYKKVNANLAAEKAAKAASKSTGFWGKLWSKVAGKIGPALIAAFTIPRIITGYKEGGLPEALKEASKAAIGLIGFAIGGVIAGMLGLSGIGAFLVPMAVSMVIDMGANSILGKSIGEQKAEIAAQQEQMQKAQNAMLAQSGVSFGNNNTLNNNNSNLFNDPVMRYVQRQIDASNGIYNNNNSIYGGNTAQRLQCYG